jgi:DNA/RNA endonuclease YhcR with UshA esterase domain
MLKIQKIALLFVLALWAGQSDAVSSNSVINTSEAINYIGKTIDVCGNLTQISDFKKGVYLNLDGEYPNNSFTIVVWDGSIKKIEAEWGSFRSLKGKIVCAKGKVETYKQKPRLNLSSSYDFYVK